MKRLTALLLALMLTVFAILFAVLPATVAAHEINVDLGMSADDELELLEVEDVLSDEDE